MEGMAVAGELLAVEALDMSELSVSGVGGCYS